MTKFEFTRGAPLILSTEIACKRKNEKSFLWKFKAYFYNSEKNRFFIVFSSLRRTPPPRFACQYVIGFV